MPHFSINTANYLSFILYAWCLYDEVYLLWKLGLPLNVDFSTFWPIYEKRVYEFCSCLVYNLFQVVCYVTYLPQNIGPPLNNKNTPRAPKITKHINLFTFLPIYKELLNDSLSCTSLLCDEIYCHKISDPLNSWRAPPDLPKVFFFYI